MHRGRQRGAEEADTSAWRDGEGGITCVSHDLAQSITDVEAKKACGAAHFIACAVHLGSKGTRRVNGEAPTLRE